jgi:isocitrate/isopropylmalate dehydrogenase
MFLKLRVYGEVVKTVSESYPDVALEFFVDNAAMQIILNQDNLMSFGELVWRYFI